MMMETLVISCKDNVGNIPNCVFRLSPHFSSTLHPYPMLLKLYYTIVFVLTWSVGLFGQDKSLLQSIKQDSALDVYLALDWKEIDKLKDEKTYVPASVTLVTGTQDTL